MQKKLYSGDYVLLSKTVTGDELTITVYWHHQNTSNQEKIAAIIPSNAIQTDSSNLRRDQTINGQSSYTGQFRILDIHKDASVKIDVSEYAVNPIIVPAVKVDDITSIYPIGTIISSMLDFDSFNKLTNNNENTGADVWSFKSKWAPCDGRPVGGSKYNVWAGAVGANAPDLRGVFLRGLNQFAPDEPTSVSANQKDPETKKAGEFQNDDLKSHTHTLKIPQFYGSSATPAGGPGVAGNNYLTYTTSTQTTGDATHPGDETRPKNVSIYYYIRIN